MKKKLLIVDDEEGIRNVLKISLMDAGYPVFTAKGVDEALEVFAKERPGIILTDIKMPGQTGLDLLRRVKELDRDTEVIMLTGHGDLELAIQSLKLDATDFLTKPVNDDVLEFSLKRAEERIRMREELRAYAQDLERKVREQSAKLVEAERQLAALQLVNGLSSGLHSLSRAADAPGPDSGTRGASPLFGQLPYFVSVHNRALDIISINDLYRERFGDLRGKKSWHAYVSGRSAPAPGSEPGSPACSAPGPAPRPGSDAAPEPANSPPPVPCPAASVLADGVGHRSREIMFDGNGRAVAVNTYTVPIYDNDGEVELILELCVDMSEVERLREELHLTQSNLSHLGLLLGSTAHGIKGLLTALDGSIYRMGSGLKLDKPERVQDGFRDMRLLVGKLRKLVLDILYYSKNRDLAWEKTPLADFARECASLVADKAAELGVALEVATPEDGGGFFEADSGAISSALVNILENGIEACAQKPAQEGPRLRFCAMAEQDSVLFEVTDNGPGMDRETREKLFTLFFSSKGSSGTGIGLFTANRAVRQHGGVIRVESETGKGATFHIRLPRRLPDEARGRKEEAGIAE